MLVQHTYGKQVSDIESMISIFVGDLSEYEPTEIIAAVRKWRRTESTFPTPADIINILKGGEIMDIEIYKRAKNIMNNTNLEHWEKDKASDYCKKYEKTKLGYTIA